MKFCVGCGIDCEETYDGLCIDCFLKNRQLIKLPHHVDLNTCANCGEFLVIDSWREKTLEVALEDAAIESITLAPDSKITDVAVKLDMQDEMTYLAHMQVWLDVHGAEAMSEGSTIVRLKNTVCKRCSRYLGNYYESILQLRTEGKDLPEDLRVEVLEKVIKYVDNQTKTNRDLFISKTEMVVGGVDIYLSSNHFGKNLAKYLTDMYCAETKEACKLVGQAKDGQEIYRLTYLVRLPSYHVGDMIEYDNKHYLLTKVSSTGGRLMDLMTFKERSIKRSDMYGMKVYIKKADFSKASVISRSANEIQILRPSDYNVEDIIIPEGEEVEEVVSVVNIEDVYYYIPSEWS